MVVYWYGQIRDTNYAALRALYGYEPPWPMGRAPHVELARAILAEADPERTSFAEYLRMTGRPELLVERVAAMRGLLSSDPWPPIATCCGSILDGNHRVSLSLVTGRELLATEAMPYQTICTPHMDVDGRRLNDRFPLDCDFTGTRVLDLGARDGMNAVHALAAGAESVVLVDNDYTSLTWQVLDDAVVPYWRRRVVVANAATMPRVEDVDVVLALSVVRHIGAEALARQASGRVVILETHSEAEEPPDTGHRWRLLKRTAYSRSAQSRYRRVFLGEP